MEEKIKTIAIFMGLFQDDKCLWGFKNTPENQRCHSDRIKDIYQYYRDWNILMPVIKEIRNNYFVTNVNYNIEGDFIIEGLTSTEKLDIIINRENFKSDLEMCYFGVVEFVKWYNQNSEKEN